MEKSKIKQFEPVTKNGEHASYTTSFGTFYNFTIEFENGTKGQVSSNKITPSWKTGEEYEFEVIVNGNYTNIKKLKPANGGYGGKTVTFKFVEIKRMVKSNSLHALIVVNNSWNNRYENNVEKLSGKELKTIEAFTLGNITGDIEKFGKESGLLISRLSCVNNAVLMSGYKFYESGQDIINEATKLYNYVKS